MPADAARPNILLVTSDQQHYRALGLHDPTLHTPAMDSLGRDGLMANRAYCNNPVCSPSRATLITGRYPSSHGCWTIGVRLPDDSSVLEPSLPVQLAHGGYATALIGKAHFEPLRSMPDQPSLESYPTLHDLDFWRDFHGPYYGFDHVELGRMHADEAHVGQHYALWMEKKGLTNWRDYFRKSWPVDDAPRRVHSWDLPVEMHYSTWVAERSIASIEQAVGEDRPFFTWASFHDPHPPYLVPEPYASMYDPADMSPGTLSDEEWATLPPWVRMTQEENPDFSPWQETQHGNHGFHSHRTDESRLRQNLAVYYGMLSLIDDQLARMLSRLDDLGVAENTIVIFTTDHGHFLGQHGLVAKGPFHYEDMIRVPFLARWPGRIPAGTRCDALTSHVDLAPTLLGAAGLPVPPIMQGVDQMPVWSGAQDSARDWVLVENRHQPSAIHVRTFVQDRYKLTIYRGEPWGELYDLERDPGERHNLFDDPAAASVKQQLAMRWLEADMERESSPYERIAGA